MTYFLNNWEMMFSVIGILLLILYTWVGVRRGAIAWLICVVITIAVLFAFGKAILAEGDGYYITETKVPAFIFHPMNLIVAPIASFFCFVLIGFAMDASREGKGG